MRPLWKACKAAPARPKPRARELNAAIEAAKAKIEANALKITEIERTRGENIEKIAAAEETIRTANAARMEKEAAVARLGRKTAP